MYIIVYVSMPMFTRLKRIALEPVFGIPLVVATTRFSALEGILGWWGGGGGGGGVVYMTIVVGERILHLDEESCLSKDCS